ncbi:MAG TPA: VOC family protein [Thermoanaerobaculia bacterium]|jgi:catechol 2,3-dioxygenase-like lactoylglutathione lyase family enzyme
MEIREFRVVVRASNYERAVKFYGDALALPQVQSWNRDTERGAVFQAGSALIEVVGPPVNEDPRANDEKFKAQGPRIQAAIVFDVASAQRAFDEISSREKNIPGGFEKDSQGRMTFATHDPDNIKVIFRETGA